ncbi:MAG: hypothetical protein O7C60_07065, partial [Rickettsia endosymbiont of Ixodes persulcatus]|nr:hypothetical protein [Rickettsia endosymbiont of Ixodes persulcatus]
VVIQAKINSYYSLFGVFNGIDRNGSLLLLYFILVLPTLHMGLFDRYGCYCLPESVFGVY